MDSSLYVMIAVFIFLPIIIWRMETGYFKKGDRADLKRIERKLDLIIRNLGLTPPDWEETSKLSEEVRVLCDKGEQIPAIKLHMEQTGTNLKEARAQIDAYRDRK
jgi:hypothetical protein